MRNEAQGTKGYIERAAEALAAGQDPREAILGEGSTTSAGAPADWRTQEDKNPDSSHESAMDAFFSNQPEPTDQAASDESTEEQVSEPTDQVDAEQEVQTSESDVEELTVKDSKGRRRKLKLDYSNRDALKKNALMAHGARKWQAERDSFKKQVEDITPKYQELQSNFEKLESAYQSGGLKGLVELLDGEGAYDQHIQSVISRHETRRNATPEELSQMDAQEAAQARDSEYEKLRKEMEELRTQAEQSKEQSELNELSSVVNPAFDKFRFDGKLGDPVQEHRLDTMLWREVTDNLDSMGEKGVELSREVVRKEFRKVSNEIRKMISVQGEKKAKKVVAKKKQEATEHAQKRVINGVQSNRSADALRAAVKGGNIGGILSNFWSGK